MGYGDEQPIDLRFKEIQCPRCHASMDDKGAQVGKTGIIHKSCKCGMVLSIVVPPRFTVRYKLSITDVE